MTKTTTRKKRVWTDEQRQAARDRMVIARAAKRTNKATSAPSPVQTIDLTDLGAQSPAPNGCLFCGEPGTKRRFVNLQSVDLCDEHYYACSIGRIVQQLRENEDGQESTDQVGSGEES